VIALGMLVDDGIVVVENIYRHYQMGKTRIEAAIDGTKEVMLPVTTATITTIVAFLPILWMPGIMGGFMRYLPITISVTLAASLFVAFIVNPMLASLFMTREDATESDEEKGLFGLLKRTYSSTLEGLLSNPKRGLISTAALTVFSIFFVFGGIAFFGALGKGVEFFPSIEPKVVAVTVEGSVGSSLEQTNQALLELEKIILNIPEEFGDIKHITTIVGSAKAEMGGTSQAESHKGYLDITFTDYVDRKVESWTTMEWLQENVTEVLPAWEVTVKKQEEGPPQGYPVSFEIVGADYKVLAPMADSLQRAFAQIPGIVNVNTDFDPARPEMRVSVDRDHAARLGVSNTQVAQAVRGALYGVDAGNFRKGDDEYDIMVRYGPKYRESMEMMREVGISFDEGKKKVPLSSVAKVTQGAALASINHIGGNRTIQVWGEAEPGLTDQQSLKTKALEIVNNFDVPPGYSIEIGTSNKEQEETTAFLLKAFLVTVALVFVTMLFQFNSISQPLLVVFGIFLSLGGVFWGMTFVQLPFSIIMTGIGIISLAGIVAKNGIVLIDFINQLRMEGLSLERAVIDGGATRLRPILLTAITAMISLIPMATGIGFDFSHFEVVTRSETSLWWAPMAWAIFWGLAFNTVLVLVMIPVLYYAYELLRERVTGKMRYASKMK
jgi:multidrug efflux pump subunit AcrB